MIERGTQRFRLWHLNQKTPKQFSVTISRVLAELLAVKLGAEPRTKKGHKVVKDWLQQEFQKGHPRKDISRWLEAGAIHFVTDAKLRNKHDRLLYQAERKRLNELIEQHAGKVFRPDKVELGTPVPNQHPSHPGAGTKPWTLC